MKNKFINFASFFFFAITSLLVVSCDNDDLVPEFTIQPSSEEVSFLNTFTDEYLLSAETKNNISERFVWNAPDFGVPTQISYSVEASISETFNSVDFDSGILNTTNYAVAVGDLFTMAQDLLLLDTDPSTTGDDGEPNNTGTIYFRINAFAGTGEGSNAIDKVSEIVGLNITLLEISLGGGSGIEISTWGIVGSGFNNWGAGPDAPFYTTDNPDVLVAYPTLIEGEIKFRENNDWTNNYGDTGVDGTLDAGGDNLIVTPGSYKVTFNTSTLEYSIEAFSWGIVGSGFNDWGGAGPDAHMFYDYTTDTFKVSAKLLDGEVKFRFDNKWDSDFGDTGADGTIEPGGDNIATTEGYYNVTLDLNNNNYLIEAADVLGIVGSGYNDWGASPDFLFSKVSEVIYIAEGVTLIDGEVKFRVNEAWSSDYGDTGVDGILDAGGDNIAVTAGVYRITLDFTDDSAPTYTLIKIAD